MMGSYHETASFSELVAPSKKMIEHSTFQPMSCWLEVRVFYVRFSNFYLGELTPGHLTLNHIPLSPDTLLQVNGGNSFYSSVIPLRLRRNRIDKGLDKVTFVGTDSIRLTGSVKFEVYDRDNHLISGVLESCNGSNGSIRESKIPKRQWRMNCQSKVTSSTGFLRGKQYKSSELAMPTIDVCVAGCYFGTPTILSNSLQLSFLRKYSRKGMMASIPEDATTESKKENTQPAHALQFIESLDFKEEADNQETAEHLESEDYSELAWFNAGLRLGVGITLGIGLGAVLGIGLLSRTFQVTTRILRKKLG